LETLYIWLVASLFRKSPVISRVASLFQKSPFISGIRKIFQIIFSLYVNNSTSAAGPLRHCSFRLHSSWLATCSSVVSAAGAVADVVLPTARVLFAGCDGVNVSDDEIGHVEFLELIAFNDAVCDQASHGYASGGISSVQESDAPLSSGFHCAIAIGYSGVYVVAEVYPEISRGV
jgi:hypothetical protein